MIDEKNKFYLKDIPTCGGRNKKFRKSHNLYRGLLTLFEIKICNCDLDLKDKIKIIKLLFLNWLLFKYNVLIKL